MEPAGDRDGGGGAAGERLHGTFSFENKTAAPITIVLGSFLVNGQAREAKCSAGGRLTSSYTVPPKKNIALSVAAGLFAGSANGTATLSFAYSEAHARSGHLADPRGFLAPPWGVSRNRWFA